MALLQRQCLCCQLPKLLSPTPTRACAAAGHTPQQKRLWKLFTAAFAVLILLIGFVGGFFTAKHLGTEQVTRCYAKAGRDGTTEDAQLLPFTRGMPVDGLALRELPPPWSEEAQAMQATPGTPGGVKTCRTRYHKAYCASACLLLHPNEHILLCNQLVCAWWVPAAQVQRTFVDLGSQQQSLGTVHTALTKSQLA